MQTKNNKTTITLVLFFATGFAFLYGIVAHKHYLFPYSLFHSSYGKLMASKHTPWAIGIYTGHTPFTLEPPAHISNPVLTHRDVTDIKAEFVADPFIVKDKDIFYMFLEVLDAKDNLGKIAYAESSDGFHWAYRKLIIEEDFHLSYPQVFKDNGDYYLIPESNADLSIRLYKAVEFPGRWEYQGNLLQGFRYVDPTIFTHDNRWWLFASLPGNDTLNLFFSEQLTGPWTSHPMNPIVKFDKRSARLAGRLFTYEGGLYRLTQDCRAYYGKQVFASRILELTPTTYREQLASETPLVKNSGTGWNATGMHQIDFQVFDEHQLVVVDGKAN